MIVGCRSAKWIPRMSVRCLFSGALEGKMGGGKDFIFMCLDVHPLSHRTLCCVGIREGIDAWAMTYLERPYGENDVKRTGEL